MGFAECVEEIERGMCSVAAPLSQDGLGATMSIGSTGSTRVFDVAFRTKLGAELCRLAGQVSDSLGMLETKARDAG